MTVQTRVYTDNFKIYNLQNVDIKLNDAVKVTSSKNESFWVEVQIINDNEIIGKVLNKLVLNSNYSLDDIIKFNKNNIKIINKSENRLRVPPNLKNEIIRFIAVFNAVHNRNPTEYEFEKYYNTKLIRN